MDQNTSESALTDTSTDTVINNSENDNFNIHSHDDASGNQNDIKHHQSEDNNNDLSEVELNRKKEDHNDGLKLELARKDSEEKVKKSEDLLNTFNRMNTSFTTEKAANNKSVSGNLKDNQYINPSFVPDGDETNIRSRIPSNAKQEDKSIPYMTPEKMNSMLVGVLEGRKKSHESKKSLTRLEGGSPQPCEGWEGLGPNEKWRIIKNLVMIGVAFMVHFTAYFGLTNLQSSINSDAGLGTASLVAVYAGLILSNIFLPALVIRWLGCKWAMSLSFLTYTPYVLAQFRAGFATLIPTAFLLGFGGGPLWCAKCTYLTEMAQPFASLTGMPVDSATARFFAVFFVFFPISQVLGNFISSFILTAGEEASNATISLEILSQCGANFCPSAASGSNPNLQRPPEYKINTLFGVFLGCMLLSSLLVGLFVDPLKRYKKTKETSATAELSGLKLLMVTMKMLLNSNQLLILPITVYFGMSQAFLSADFTQSYVGCAWGIEHIGFVLTVYGLANAASTVFVSWVVRWIGRAPVVGTGLMLYVATVLLLLLWQPSPDSPYAFYLVVCIWACGDSTFSIVNALYGIVFPGEEEAAYSNFRLWESVGFILSYSYSASLCTQYKLYVMMCVLIPAAIGYALVEVRLAKRPRRLFAPPTPTRESSQQDVYSKQDLQ